MPVFKTLPAALAASLMLAACSNDVSEPPMSPDPVSPQTPAAPVAPVTQESVVSGNTQFGMELYSVLAAQREDNLFISPASISTAFGLAYAGARGKAAEEMVSVLHFDPSQGGFHPAMGTLARSLQHPEKGQTLRINNAVWLDNSLVVEPRWLATVTGDYAAEDTRANFSTAPNEARLKINRWVEEKTEDRIKDLLAPSHVDESTRAVLVNTIYMHADWLSPFSANATGDAPFTLASGEAVDVKMMTQTNEFRHAETADLQILEMPYKGEALSMVVVLPKETDGIGALEAGLSYETLTDWMNQASNAEPVRVNLKLPKLELKDKFELGDTLQGMGLVAPFDGNPAYFAGMVDPAKQPGGGGVSIDKVIHQTFLKVDEKGTEAAAATAITMRKTAIIAPEEPPVAFHADHPFLLVIKDNASGSVLFLGRIADPR